MLSALINLTSPGGGWNIILSILLLGMLCRMGVQYPVDGIVIDAETKQAIPYVNIGISALSKGTVSDVNGKFSIMAHSENDQLTFSAIGYETFHTTAGNLKNSSALELVPKDYLLNAIEITADKFVEKEVMLGVKNDKRGHSIGFGSAQLGTEIGAAIKIEKPTYIKSANFVLNHAKGDSLLLRVNIYEIREGNIGENLLAENILIKEKQRRGTISVDLSAYNIVLQTDVLLALEWLRNFDENGNKDITFDTKKVKSLRGIYVKYSSTGAFIKLPHQKKRKPCFYFTGKQVK